MPSRNQTQEIKKNTLQIYQKLNEYYPPIKTFLTHKNEFELLIAVILSAQCTDERVNQVSPELFKRFPTPQKLAKGPLEEIQEKIKSINFFRNKAINIQKTGEILNKKYHSKVPETLEALIKLPGVGRKTANVILAQAFGKPAIAVDTHVKRLSKRLGFSQKETPEDIEKDLQILWQKEHWSHFSTLLIIHGRTFCMAKKPNCATCFLKENCPKIGI